MLQARQICPCRPSGPYRIQRMGQREFGKEPGLAGVSLKVRLGDSASIFVQMTNLDLGLSPGPGEGKVRSDENHVGCW